MSAKYPKTRIINCRSINHLKKNINKVDNNWLLAIVNILLSDLELVLHADKHLFMSIY